MRFNARINSRSTTRESGPPGEAEILILNPQRREMILGATGWITLFPGTLNLEVDDGVVRGLLLREPIILEDAGTVR